MPARNPDRRADLAAIHIAQKALGLTADDAMVLKRAVVGVDSAADMTPAQRRRYLAHLSGLQKARAPADRRPAFEHPRAPRQRSVDDAADARWSKARMLWHVLAQAGAVQADTDAALMAYVRRQTRAEHWRFLNSYQINAVIEALKDWGRRVGASND